MLTRIALVAASVLSLDRMPVHEHDARAGRIHSGGGTCGGRCAPAHMAAGPHRGPGEFEARAARRSDDCHARQ